MTLIDPTLAREYPEGKLGILDIRLRTASGKSIDIEIQLNRVTEIHARMVYYACRMITDQMGSGGDYLDIKRSICILITDFALFRENKRYHSRYRLYDIDTELAFTDLLEVITLELPKLPQDSDGTARWDWLRFMGARRQEELEMLAEKNPQVCKAVAKLMELNADERARLIADSRQKLRWDIASIKKEGLEEGLERGRVEGREEGLEKGREEGREEGREAERLAIARKLLGTGMPAENVAQITELSRETIQTLLH